MEERTVHLKVKIQSLAAEARIIRAQAKKARGMEKWELNHHRTSVVRVHARLSLLAYGLLRGTPYAVMERCTADAPSWKKVENLARRFGADDDAVSVWMTDAITYMSRPAEPERLSA